MVYFWPQLVQGRALYWGDIGLYFAPMQQFLHDRLRAGQIPLWNPLILCGAPYVGNPQTWPLYPVSALLNLMPAPSYLNWTIALHVWFAGLGTFLFLRRAMCVGRAAALLGAITFAFGGQLVSKEQFPNMVQATAYLPWVLWLVQRLVRGLRLGNALWLGLALGLQLLAAHAQMTLLTVYLSAAYGLSLLWPHRHHRRLLGRIALLALLAGVVAVGLAAGQLLPTAELYRDAWRQRLSFRVVDRFYLPCNQLLNFVLPTQHGHPIDGNYTARGTFWETCCYVGWLPLALACLGSWRSWRSSGAWTPGRFWTGVLLVGLAMAMGGQTWRGNPTDNGLYRLAYQVLPGFRNFHDPARCLLWVCFALSVLAAAGLDGLRPTAWKVTPIRLASAFVLFVAFADLAHFGRTLYPLTDPAALRPTVPTVAFLRDDAQIRAHQARYLAPDTARAWQRFTAHRSYRQNEPDFLSLWTDTLTPNLMMPYGLLNAYGYEPVTRLDTQKVMGTANDMFHADAATPQHARAAIWAGYLGVAYVMTMRSAPPGPSLPGLVPVLADPTLPPVGQRNDPVRLFLSRNVRWQPRARLMTEFVSVASPKRALTVMSNALRPGAEAGPDFGRSVLVAGRVPFASVPGSLAPAQIMEDEPDRVAVSADVTHPSLLVLADTLHPGWRATVDGRDTPILSANGCLRAVALSQAGPHRVVFSYRPTSFALGLYLSLLTTLGLTAGGAHALAGKRQNRAGV